MPNRVRWFSHTRFLALFSVFVWIITISSLIHYKNQVDLNRITEKVNAVTRDRIDLLKEKTNDLVDILKNQSDSNLISIDFSVPATKGISFFVGKKGKLLYWSDNSVSFEAVQELAIGNHTVVQLPNGWYLFHRQKVDSFDITSLALVKYAYPYTNDHLKNTFQSDYKLPLEPEISDTEATYNVLDGDERFLFSLHFDENKEVGSVPTHWPLLILSLLSFATLLGFVFRLHQRFNPFPGYPNFPILAFIVDLVIIRWAVFYFSWPGLIHDFYIFNPQLFASSLFYRSLGDLLFHAVALLMGSWFLVTQWKSKAATRQKKYFLFQAVPLFLLVALMILVFGYTIRSLIMDSTLTFNLISLLSVDVYSFVGWLIIVLLSIGFMMLIFKCHEWIIELCGSIRKYLWASLPVLVLTLVYALVSFEAISLVILLVFVSTVFIWTLPVNRREDFFVNRLLLFMVVVSVAITWLINSYDSQKEKELMKLVATADAHKDDPMAEYLFGNARELMYTDTALAEMLFLDSLDEDMVITYLLTNYFDGGEQYWARYNFQVTICNDQQSLMIEGQNRVVNCFDFFKRQVEEYGNLTMTNGFYLIYDPFGQASYLGLLQFENREIPERGPMAIFMEIFPKIVPVEVGYLDLLVDQEIKDEASLYQYAHARYYNKQLVTSYGKYVYSIDQNNYPVNDSVPGFFNKGGYTHYYFPSANGKILIVSLPEKELLDKMAPFSLFLLLFVLIYTLGITLRNILIRKIPFKTNFKNRLQFTLLFVILFSFMVIGIASVYYIGILNKNKNIDNLKDKARSIRIEVEHKLADKAILNEELKPYIESILLKFNDVFATDINLFDADGKLLGTSRQRIFQEGLISSRMNNIAYREMVLHQKTLLIHEENIGGLKFLSAYIPFKNNQNTIVAYINLPYFARQSELSDEISSFVMAFINIYLLLIAITIVFAFFLSDRISKPLILIRDRMQQVRLGSANEKIDWRGHDEISDLVMEYNRMVDELEKSAELLARSERETAWREMARQVAHEIKNPLTPMKLNLQHLEQTISGDPDQWKEKFSRFSKVMLQQIDSLSTIATAFSDFANMPRGTTSLVPLEEIIVKAASLFEGYQDVTLDIRTDPSARAEIKGDPEQLSRLVINLITNAVQAKLGDKPLTVRVSLEHKGDYWLLTVQDDGKGMDEEIASKIFVPNFTTKSSGTGLGLAIARNIVEGMGGSITFTSEPLKGTTFSVVLPIES